jgi:hypothetical protein
VIELKGFSMRVCAALIAVGSMIGCKEIPHNTFIRPTPVEVPSPAAAPPVPIVNTASILEVRNPTVVVYRPAVNEILYDLAYVLAETTGKSGATVVSLQVGIFGGDQAGSDPGCWVKPLRIEPGSTLKIEPDSLGYCAPTVGSHSEVSNVFLIVGYKDDEGRAGSVRETVPVK